MIGRRGLAMVMTVVFSAAVMTSVAATPATAGLTTAGSAASAAKICVALVVDARSIGGTVSTDCAKVSKGATGVDVLDAAGHRLGFRRDGLLCTIDGLPKSGCSGVDDSHYWAYFHRAPGSTHWSYSSEGSASYQPAANSTEGWVYDDGSALTPDNVPQTSICKPSASPSPSPTPSHRATAAAHPSAKPKTSPTAARSATPTTSPSASPAPTRSAKPKPRHHPRATDTPSSVMAGSVGPPSPSSTSSRLSLVNAASSSSGSHRARALLTWLIVLAVLILLAATAYRTTRRNRS